MKINKNIHSGLKFSIIPFIMAFSLFGYKATRKLNVEVYETSAQGNSLKK